MAGEKITIAELDINTDALVTAATNSKAVIDSLRREQKKLKDEGKASSEQFVKNEVAIKRLSSQYNEQKNVLVSLNSINDKFLKTTQAVEKAVNKENKTLQEARNNNKELLKVRNQLDLSTKSGVAALNQINQKLDQNNAFIKDNVSAYEKQKINIGNYQSALSRVSPVLGNIATVLGNVTNGLIAKNQAMKAAATGTGLGTKAMRLFKIALISTGIGAFLVILGSLAAAFKSSEEGQSKFSKLLGTIGVIVGNITDIFANFGEKIISIFENPRESWEAFVDSLNKGWDFVKDQIITRFKSNFTILSGVFRAGVLNMRKAWNDFTGDAEEAELITQQIKEITKEVKNAKDELDRVNGAVINGLKGARDSVAGFIQQNKDEIAQQRKVQDLILETDKLERGLIVERKKSDAEVAELRLKARQEEKFSAEERLKFLNEALRVEDATLEKEQQVAANRLSIQSQQNSFSKSTKENLDAEAELEAKLFEIQRKRADFSRTIERERIREGRKVRAEAQKIVNEGLKAQQTEINIFLAGQGIKKKSFEDELKLAEELTEKKKALLKDELDAGKKNRLEYDLAIIQADNELLKKRSDIIIQSAQRELEIFNNANQSKLDANQFFNNELLTQETDRLNRLAQAERDFQAKRLEEGVINQQEYNDAINAVNEENRLAQEELRIEREEAQKEKDLIDLENQTAINEENFLNFFEAESVRLEQARLAEVENAKKTGADVALINQKFALRQRQLDEATAQAKVLATGDAFGAVADFVGKETALGKFAALAQSSINIEQGITKALATKGFAGIIEGALIAAKGAVSIAKITSTDTSFHTGGQVPKGTGGRITAAPNIPTQAGGDNILATVKRGEVILNEEQQARAGGDAFFRSIGVPNFDGGGRVPALSSSASTKVAGGVNLNAIGDIIASKINDMKIVAIQDEITNAQISKAEIIDGAKI